MDISKHADDFVKEMKRRNYGEQTIQNYASCIRKFFAESSKEHPIHINESDIKLFLGKFTEPNTQRAYHSAIKKFYVICLNQKNKFRYIPYCKKSSKLPIVLSVQEIQSMFSACQNLKHKVILALLYSAGLRVSELINLKWSHIDRSRMIINIIQAKGKKDRQVPLKEKIIPLMEEYWKQYKPKEYVFNGQSSLQYTDRSVGEVIKQLATKAGIKKHVKTHLIRHCYATHCVEDGMDINFLQKLLGHSNVKTTMVYTHISNNLISKANSPINQIQL